MGSPEGESPPRTLNSDSYDIALRAGIVAQWLCHLRDKGVMSAEMFPVFYEMVWAVKTTAECVSQWSGAHPVPTEQVEIMKDDIHVFLQMGSNGLICELERQITRHSKQTKTKDFKLCLGLNRIETVRDQLNTTGNAIISFVEGMQMYKMSLRIY